MTKMFGGKESKAEEAMEAKAGKKGKAKMYAKGGYVRGADGVTKQGKTKGKII